MRPENVPFPGRSCLYPHAQRDSMLSRDLRISVSPYLINFASMKLLPFVFCLCCAVAGLSAQEFSLYHGTWFHAKFLEALTKTSSLEGAMQAKSSDEPLYVRIDSTSLDGKITAAYKPGTELQLLILKTSVPNAGMKWAIGTQDLPMWLVAVDERNQTYISLTKTDSLEGTPIVLGKLPSKNPDPMFILRRMVNASMLSGQWTTSDGKDVSFTNGMVATMMGTTFSYDISIDSQSYAVTMTSTQGKPKSYVVQRMGKGLTLTQVHGNKTTQVPIVLKRKTP